MTGLKWKELNFIEAEKRKDRQAAKAGRVRILLVLLPVALMAIFTRDYLYVRERIREMAEASEQMAAFLASDQVKAGEEKGKYLHETLEVLRRYEQEAQAVTVRMDAGPKLPGRFLEEIEGIMENGVSLRWTKESPVQYDQGILRFEVMARMPGQPSAYIQRLERSEVFPSVTYDGFMRNEDPLTGEVFYRFSVACSVTGDAEGEVEP